MLKISKIRILTISIIAVLLTLVGTVCFAAEEKVEVKLNRKVYFEGDTYTYHNAKKVRKDYEDGELGCGIISIILKNKEYGVYITGEGWIKPEQIKSSERYISLDFNRTDGRLASEFKVNGEHLNVESDNTGIIDYKDGVLKAGVDGTTTVKFTDKNGKEVEVLATVHNGEIELNVPEKSLSAEAALTTDIAEGKVNIGVAGGATATLKVENGEIGIDAEAAGIVDVKAGDIEIINAEGTGNANATIGKDGATVKVEATQKMTLLQKLALKLNERADAAINKEQASVSVGGDAVVNDKEVALGDLGVSYDYDEEDPEANIKLEIMDKELVNKQEVKIPIISTIKSLLAKLKK